MEFRIRLFMGMLQLCMVFTYSSLRGNPVSEIEFSQIRDSSFISKGLAWVLLENDRLKFTRNGGKKWRELFNIPKKLKRIVFVSDKIGWGVTIDGRIYQTKNGGENWINTSNLDQNWLEDCVPEQIGFFDSQKGWILAAPYFLFNTIDGG